MYSTLTQPAQRFKLVLVIQFTDRNDVTTYLLRDSVNKLTVPLPCTNYQKLVKSYQYTKCCNLIGHSTRYQFL